MVEKEEFMKINKAYLVSGALIIAGLFLIGCPSKSILSNVTIDDPALIKIDINLDKSRNQLGSVTENITARIKDKNDDIVELKNGSISINNINMELQYELISKLPYYYIPSSRVPYVADSNYSFVITLSNGKQYKAGIKTQTKEFHTFQVSDNHNKANALSVSWQDIDTSGQVLISVFKNFTNSKTATDTIYISDASKGTYTFEPAYFGENPESMDLTLSSVKYGDIDSSFMNGSSISSKINISRKVKFIP